MNRRNKNRDENQPYRENKENYEKKRDERSLQKNENFHPEDCSCEYCQSREKREKLARNEEQRGHGREFNETSKWPKEEETFGKERRKSNLGKSKKTTSFKKKPTIKKLSRSTKPKRRKAA